MCDKESVLDALLRQAASINIPLPRPIPYSSIQLNCDTGSTETQDYSADAEPYLRITPNEMSEKFQPVLRTDELSTIRKLLEQCTIDATRREVIHILETACSHPEECTECPYKNSLGECNRNERIADILLNRLGRVK